MEVPNIDALDLDELSDLEDVFLLLAGYCKAKRAAMYARMSGRICDAMRHEGYLRDMYGRLPEWARW